MNATSRLPVVFVGHGSPFNAIEENEFSINWNRLASQLPRPKAILVVSAHWITESPAVCGLANPPTIHDFTGFPDELYRVEYPAPGSPALASRACELLRGTPTRMDSHWGLDHGAWTVLVHMYPKADIPVVQLSLVYELPFERQRKIGAELAPLRKEGVLILCSGNPVHNLAAADLAEKPYDWAVDADLFLMEALIRRNLDALDRFPHTHGGRMAHPVYDHYLPLLHAVGASAGDEPQFFNGEIFAGSIGMRCAVFGADRLDFSTPADYPTAFGG
jgi:4,5-DOPA dioxygenase extradiol